MTRVFYADISCLLNNEIFKKALFVLSQKDRDKINNIKPVLNKCQSLGSRVLLECFFREYPKYNFEKEICQNKSGKPYFKNCSNMHLSLSHSGSVAVCAVSSQKIGADVQAVCEFNEKICQKYFSKEECSYVLSAPLKADREKRFARIWALKEAYVKMTGEGIFKMKKLSLPITDGVLNKASSAGFFNEFYENNYSFAFCTEDKEDDFEIKKINLADLLIN